MAIVSVLQTILLTMCLTDYLKAYNGRLRPNFFDACGYPYDNVTGIYGVIGHRGDYSKCTCSKNDLAELRRSFPSGHSSYSFSGLCFTSLILFYTIKQIYLGRFGFTKIIISGIPFLGAVFIACSRPVYYKNILIER